MGDDDGQAVRFTDEELAFLRHVRFGELPARIKPADLIEETETVTPQEGPAAPAVRWEWA